MKRLLTCLFLVLGLGLVFSTPSSAKFKTNYEYYELSSDTGIGYYIDKKYNLTDYQLDAVKYCKTRGKSKAALTQRSLSESNIGIYTKHYSQLLKKYKTLLENEYAKNRVVSFFCIDQTKELGLLELVWLSDSATQAQQIAKKRTKPNAGGS